jgi:4-amino-4-deoxy-L-arabinose transferase-like glycosyltransferase
VTNDREHKEHNTNVSERNVGYDDILRSGAPLPGFLLLVILTLANGLLLAPSGSPFRIAAALALLLLPGLAWAERLLPATDPLTRWTVGAGLGYALGMVLGLILHYLPGPIPLWAELVALDALALVPRLMVRDWRLGASRPAAPSRDPARAWRGMGQDRSPRGPGGAENLELGYKHWLLAIFLLAALFRFASLGYSEFQGDEALAMISAAESLEGHQDALFLRGKGPGEVLLPMILWRLTGTINESMARLPFAIAGLLMVLTTYLLGRKLFSIRGSPLGKHAGLIAAGLLALNGFTVAFSRIVQYQTLVMWMSGLAVLCAWEWRASRKEYSLTLPHTRWAGLAGAFVGVGLLAHYDAILVAPAVGYLGWTALRRTAATDPEQSARQPSAIPSLLAAACCLLTVAGLFYLPYLLDPQAARTGGYLGDRIGHGLLKNNLDSFLHFNIFYNSSYYVILTGLLGLGFLAWALHSAPGVQHLPKGQYWVPVLAVVAALGLALRPDTLRIAGLDLATLVFALILLGAFLSSALTSGERAVVAWLAVPFLGYNFAVALPLTHIYTVVPAWTLLAGLAAVRLWDLVQSRIPGTQRPHLLKSQVSNLQALIPALCLLSLTSLFSAYLYSAYLRHDVEFWQDWPDSRPLLYWSPYQDLPPAGFFGFVHRSGWKEVGALYAEGTLSGDYGSNEEPDVTTWYTRGAPRACDPQPEYYLIADDLIDPWPVDLGIIQASYDAVGRVTVPNGKGLTLYQARPSSVNLGQLPADGITRAFDRTATPAAFARSARGSQPADANLGNLVRLIGYDVDTRRAWPGGRVAVTLYWQAQVPIADDYHVFVHLEGAGETGSAPPIWGQADGRPVCWTYPTFDWRPGQIIADQHAVNIKPDTPRGNYPLVVGMYLPDSGARLDVLDEAGEPLGNFMELTTVSIQ